MKKINVLIVDDNEQDRYLLKRQLKDTQLDLNFFEKENGQEAIDFLKDYDKNRQNFPEEFPPAVVFLDINMPILSGLEFLEQFATVREVVAIQSVVIMMFTSSEMEQDKKNACSHDFVKGYLLKGKFTSEQLKEHIERAVDI